MTLDSENIRYCSDYSLKRALEEIQFEIADREYKKIQENSNSEILG